jgi:site-specific recombinase XerD
MTTEQAGLFDKRAYRGTKPQTFAITPPTADMSVLATLPAYHAYLSSVSDSQYTPDDFTADLKRFGQFVANRPLSDVQTGDIQQWIGTLKETMPPKTVSRKVAAIANYFRWLAAEKVLEKNPAQGIRAARVTAPLPDLLYESECKQLLATASQDPRTYLLVLLVLETGLKKSELLELQVSNFDFSNKYQPELWVRHGGKAVFKDRRLKLPGHFVDVFNDYVRQYDITDALFPFTQRTVSQLLADAGRNAKISKKVSAGILRDMFVVRSVKQGGKLEDAFEKIGLAKSSYDDARKKYGRLTRGAL